MNNRYISVENYTSTNFGLLISLLHVSLSLIEENFTANDFSVIYEQFVESQNSVYQFAFAIVCDLISQTAIDRDDVKHDMNMLTSNETDDIIS